MSLILYTKAEMDFQSQGIGVLAEAVNDEVRETLTGIFELTLQYPVTGKWADYLLEDYYIRAKPNDIALPQPFRIYRVNRAMNGWITVYARHVAYRMKTIVCRPFTADGDKTFLAMLSSGFQGPVNDCPFTFETDRDYGIDYAVAKPADIWTLLGSGEGCFQEIQAMEVEFDRWTVKLLEQRGADRGVTIVYGKNLLDLEAEKTADLQYNGIFPYWENSEGNICTLPEELIMRSDYAEGTEKRIMPMDVTDAAKKFDYDLDLLRTYVTFLVNTQYGDSSSSSIKVDFVQLSKTEEYKDRDLPDGIAPGDTVSVVIPQLGISAKIRVSEVRYQPSQSKYKSITLGSPRGNILRTMSQRLRG